MIPDISKKIARLKANPKILEGIFRGIERETLRITKNGHFSKKIHPYLIGSSLTHKWITTDFSENLLEFVTPKSDNIDYLLSFLKDLHCFTASKTHNERMWPFSIPYCYSNQTKIQIAQYGESNLGRMKTIYRKGLKSRYGDLINTVSGVHYNFSLPLTFWQNYTERKDKENKKNYISSGYFNLIRNYYRFGWIIPYLFGASPAISSHFLKNQRTNHKFKKNKKNFFYLPWSTSLRLSNIGYYNTQIKNLNIMFDNLSSYLESFQKAIETPSKKFINIGLKDVEGNFQQLNTNIFQIENELYTQIRPKRQTNHGESLIEALKTRGVEYVEIRSLDINPFSPIGINKNQILLLDLFLIWCALVDSFKINKKDFLLITKNWERIIFEGRKPNQKIYINEHKTQTLIEISEIILKDLNEIALILDYQSGNFLYQKTCKKIKSFFKNPELTYSGRFFKLFMQKDIKKVGLQLANQYHRKFINKNYLNLSKNILEKESVRSHMEQKKIEQDDFLSFKEYIK